MSCAGIIWLSFGVKMSSILISQYLCYTYLFATFLVHRSDFFTAFLPLRPYFYYRLVTVLSDTGCRQIFCKSLPISGAVKCLLCLLIITMKFSSRTVVLFGRPVRFLVTFWPIFDFRSKAWCTARMVTFNCLWIYRKE